MNPGLVVSGGQTGVDRAALDAAAVVGFPYGGWCPKGGLAEDFDEPPGLLGPYPGLRETPMADPAQRTEWNVHDSDATLIIRPAVGSSSPGSDLTGRLAKTMGRPLFVLDPDSPDAVSRAVAFLGDLRQSASLNFAGPRESEVPGIYLRSRAVIERILLEVGGV